MNKMKETIEVGTKGPSEVGSGRLARCRPFSAIASTISEMRHHPTREQAGPCLNQSVSTNPFAFDLVMCCLSQKSLLPFSFSAGYHAEFPPRQKERKKETSRTP